MKRLLILALMAGSIAACKRDNSGQQNQAATNLAELTVPQNFDWSSSVKGSLNVELTHEPGFSTEGQEVWIINVLGERVDRAVVHNNQVSFQLTMRQDDPSLFLYYPATGDQQRIIQSGNLSFPIHLDIENELNAIITPISETTKKKSAGARTQTSLNNRLSNGDFELNSFAQHNFSSSYIDDGKWYYNDNAAFEWKDENSSKVIKSKKNKVSYFYQYLSVTPGDSFTYSCDAHGSSYVFLVWFKANAPSYYGYHMKGRSANTINITDVVPADAAFMAVVQVSDNKAWTDNVYFGTTPAIADADGDGVADSQDDFPNDATRAYSIDFPSGGRQTLGFEDLWPARGDYDFNDLVITNKMSFNQDANGNLVDCDVVISLDANGAGVASGLALLLLDQSKQALSSNVIASVSSNVSLDPDNTNGVIVFNKPSDMRTDYYTNTAGDYHTPDTLKFTITFNANAASQNLLPELYIFRNDDRGRETHLPGYSPSAAADPSYFNNGYDVNGTYKTANGLPWAMEVITGDGVTWQHPLEKVDILQAFPQFQGWAINSGGQNQNWYKNPNSGNVVLFQ